MGFRYVNPDVSVVVDKHREVYTPYVPCASPGCVNKPTRLSDYCEWCNELHYYRSLVKGIHDITIDVKKDAKKYSVSTDRRRVAPELIGNIRIRSHE